MTTLFTVERVSAQTELNSCHNLNDYSTEVNSCQSNTSKLSQQKWRILMKKYYRTRYRNKFQEDNSFLSLKEVNRLLGFSGKRNKIKKGGSHQYLSWQDKEDPNKKIEAVFVYYHLVGLRSKGFDRSELHKLKTPTSYIGDR
ncbi:MAG: hypothetical protein ACFCAD_26300 [Pleurocapsa sp.]